MQLRKLQDRGSGADIARGARELAAEARLRRLLDAAPSGILTADNDGHIIDANVAARRIWAHVEHPMIGRRLSQLIPALDPTKLARLREGSDKGVANDSVGAFSAMGVKSTGDLFPVAVTITGDRDTITLFCEDMSARVAADIRLHEVNADLALVGRQNVVSDLGADLAHELNQPLAAAGNFLFAARTLIERGVCGMQVAELLLQGEAQTRRASGLIRRMRDFAVKRAVKLRAEAVSDIVGNACELGLLGAKRNAVSIALDLDPAADRVIVDSIQIEQVFVNLLRNAVEAIAGQETPGRIIIASRRVGDVVELSVADNGPGLPAGLSARLGTRFVSSKGSGGMGIGLSISKRIIEAHGGTLDADDQPTGGAIFRFSLPSNHGPISC